MKLIIFLPAFNEGETIAGVIKSLPRIPGFTEQQTLVVNDGSSDNTAEKAKSAGAIVVSHSTNMGVGGAFQTGVKEALNLGADVLVTIDADGQFPVERIPLLVKPVLDNQADFVTGSRFLSKEVEPDAIPKIKMWGNKQVAKLISLLLGKKFTDVSCGFRCYSREALLRLNLFGNFTYTQEVFIDLSAKKMRIMEIPVPGVKYKTKRKSRVYRGALNYAIRSLGIVMRTIRDFKPLTFFGFLGLGIFSLGLIADIFLLVHYILSHTFSPYIFVGFIGGFLNILGLVVIFFGLVADMLGRIRMNQENILYFLKKMSFKKD